VKKSRFSLRYEVESMVDLVSGVDHRVLAVWAIACAERVLPYFEASHPEDGRPPGWSLPRAACPARKATWRWAVWSSAAS
jgi:hypothetical protein